MPYIIPVSTIVIPSIVFFLQFQKRELLLKTIKPIFWLTALLLFSYAGILSYFQYQAFQSGPLSYTIGTVDGLKYFFSYARFHFWNTYLVSFIVALLLFWVSAYLDKKRGQVHFEHDELYIIALGILITGYPAFLFYIVLVLLLAAISSALLVKKNERLPLYYFWMPSAIITTLLVALWAGNQGWWASFRF